MARSLAAWILVGVVIGGGPAMTSADEQVRGEYHVHHEMRDTDAQLVPGAVIRVFGARSFSNNGLSLVVDSSGLPKNVWTLLSEATADEQGRCQLKFTPETDGCLFQLQAKGYPTVTELFYTRPSTSLRHEVLPQRHLTRGSPVQFHVRDENGKPIPDATLWQVEEFHSNDLRTPPPGFAGVVTTDREGAASLPVDTRDAQSFWVHRVGYFDRLIAVGMEDCPKFQQQADFRRNRHILQKDAPVRVILKESASLKGRLVDSQTGQPIPGATVVIEQSHFPQRPIPWSREDDSAHYNGTIQGESGDDGHFIIHGLRPIEHTLTAWSGDRFFHLEVDLAKPEMRDLSELKADRGRTIQGQAIDVETGQPAVVEGGIVEFRSHDGVTFSRPLEPDGSFLLRTPKCEGTLSLLPNAQWHLVTKRDKWTPARTFMVLPVQRYRPQLTDAQIIADLPQFPHDYKLEPGQFVRRIMAPYPKSREAFFAFAASKDVPQPDWMIDNLKDAYQPPQAGEPPLQSPPEATFVIDAQNRIGLAKWVMHSGPSDRSSCLFPDIGESRFRVDSETRIDGLKPLGDLLFREGATPVEFAAALNQEYQKEPRLPFKVTVHEEVFKTLVIHGPLDSEKLKTVSTLECIPEGYTGRTHFLSNGNGPWPFGFYRGRDLGLAYTLDTKIDPAIHPLSIKTPEPPDFYAPGQTVEEYQKLFSAYQAEIHKLLPAAFKAQLGIDAEIKDVSLPVIEVKYDP